MRRFYSEKQITEGDFKISGEEAKHISRVLRMQAGDMLVLFDGSGYDFLAKIVDISPEEVTVEVSNKQYSTQEPQVAVTLYQAVIKSDHMDYVTQKCTELGVSEVVPYLSARCVKRPDKKAAEKLRERQQRIAKEAAKQCGRSCIPVVRELTTISLIAKEIRESFTLLAYEDEKKKNIKQCLQEGISQKISVIIGPEGGFEPDEVAILKESGACVCTLGNLILRSETAGAAALAMIGYELMEGL